MRSTQQFSITLTNGMADAVRAKVASGEYATYADAIVGYCESWHTSPHRGTRRDDIRPGLRFTNYKRRAVIAFEVDDAAATVAVLGVFYGGRGYEHAGRFHSRW